MTKEKTFTIRIEEKELRDPKIRDGLIKLINLRLTAQKHKPYVILSAVECEILKKHNSWTDVSLYKPKKKERYPGETGKYLGKRISIRGAKWSKGFF